MSDPNVTFTKPEDLCPFKVPAETFWEIARFAGDGYDRADLARTRGWSAQYNWGQDGWDFLEPPYYMGYIRDTDDGFEFATNCEGDVDVWRFPTKELREQAMDLWAFLNWERKGESWVQGVTADAIPDHLRGPFSWDRVEKKN